MKEIAQTIASKVSALGFTKSGKPMVADQGAEVAAAIAGCRNAHVLRSVLKQRGPEADLALIPDNPAECDGVDFIMKDGVPGIWITVDELSVHICRGSFPKANDGGLRVYVYGTQDRDTALSECTTYPEDTPDEMFAIYSPSEAATGIDGNEGYWSNTTGWGSGESATLFTVREKEACSVSLPVSPGNDARWVPMPHSVPGTTHAEDQDENDEAPSFTNHYLCTCGAHWEDEWSAACNDRCPECNREIEAYASDDGSMSDEEVADRLAAAVSERAYVVADAWSHIFDGIGERTVRFVFDREKQKIVFMQAISGPYWISSTAEQITDVEDSVIIANSEALSEPYDCGLTATDDLPSWAEGRLMA